MRTRAIYTFIDNFSRYDVYKHWDNYPSGAVKFIRNALKKSWELPRFEAGEFAAAFISANKKSSGDIWIAQSEEDFDVNFRYEIECKDRQIYVKVFIADDEDCFLKAS